MKHIIHTLILFGSFLSPILSQSEQDESGLKLRIGMNLGVYKPNKAYAQFMDGSHPNGVKRILTNQIIRPQLEELFNYGIINWTYPTNLNYNITLMAGGYLGLNLDEDVSIILNFDLIKTKITEILTIELNNPQNIQGQFEQANISAKEQRFDASLGLENVFNRYGPIEFYGSGGVVFNYIEFKQHDLIIRQTKRYNIMRIPAYYGQQRKKIDGFGYGFFGQLGGRYKFNKKFSFDIGLGVNYTKNKQYVANLVENTGYPNIWIEDASKFKLNWNTYFRIIWN